MNHEEIANNLSNNIEGSMPYKHGEICEHDILKRKCDVCWLQWEKDEWQKRALQAERDRDVLAAELRAWRPREDRVGTLTRLGELVKLTDASGALTRAR